MERITQITQDCFGAVFQLRQAESSLLPPAEAVHARMRGFVDDLLRRAEEARFNAQDAQDIAYALVALIDETALAHPDALAPYWMANLLQYHFFHETLAGDGFFQRLASVRQDPRRHEVLRVYHLCLLFGFQGRYRVRGGELELMALTEAVQHELARRTPEADGLSPHGARPSEALARPQRAAPLLMVAAGAVVLALVVYGGLRVSLQGRVASVVDEIAAWSGK